MPVRISACVTAVTYKSCLGRSSNQAMTSGLGTLRITSETILVSRMNNAELPERWRVPHRLAGRQLQFDAAKRFEEFMQRRP